MDFRQFLIRHHTLFRSLHTWTVRLLVPRRFRKAVALYKAALREELWTPLDPSVSKALQTYFRERKKYDHFALRAHLQSLGISLRSATEAVDELDVQGILAFAERILPRASDL